MYPRRTMWRTVRMIVPTVAWAVAASLVGLLVVRRFVSPEALRQSNDAVGNYLQTLGTIYAVLLAFVVFVVWQQFNDARAQVEAEANEMLDLVRTVKGLPPEVRRPLLEQADAYLHLVVGHEWTAMARDADAELEEGSRTLDRMWDLLVEYEPCSECHKSLYGEALARFNDLSDRRSDRLSSSRLRIPLALWLLLRTGAGMTVASIYLFAVERLEIHLIMTAALAGAIAHVLYIVRDLDSCFDGDWQVPRAPYEKVSRYVAAALADGGTAISGPR